MLDIYLFNAHRCLSENIIFKFISNLTMSQERIIKHGVSAEFQAHCKLSFTVTCNNIAQDKSRT